MSQERVGAGVSGKDNEQKRNAPADLVKKAAQDILTNNNPQAALAKLRMEAYSILEAIPRYAGPEKAEERVFLGSLLSRDALLAAYKHRETVQVARNVFPLFASDTAALVDPQDPELPAFVRPSPGVYGQTMRSLYRLFTDARDTVFPAREDNPEWKLFEDVHNQTVIDHQAWEDVVTARGHPEDCYFPPIPRDAKDGWNGGIADNMSAFLRVWVYSRDSAIRDEQITNPDHLAQIAFADYETLMIPTTLYRTVNNATKPHIPQFEEDTNPMAEHPYANDGGDYERVDGKFRWTHRLLQEAKKNPGLCIGPFDLRSPQEEDRRVVAETFSKIEEKLGVSIPRNEDGSFSMLRFSFAFGVLVAKEAGLY